MSTTHRHTHTCLCVKLAQALSLTSLELCLTVPRVFLQALFLVDDDVLNVLHGEVLAEGVEQDVFQLLQGDPLHVELQGERDEIKWDEIIRFLSFPFTQLKYTYAEHQGYKPNRCYVMSTETRHSSPSV